MSDTGGDDPATIERLVVSRADLVAAVEARARDRRETVLRVTPPFVPRMRARLHVAGTEADYGDPAPIHVDPRVLVADLPPFPGQAPERWRTRVADAVRETVTLDTPAGSVTARVVLLG